MPRGSVDTKELENELKQIYALTLGEHESNSSEDQRTSRYRSSSIPTPDPDPSLIEATSASRNRRYERYSYSAGQPTKIKMFSHHHKNVKPTQVLQPFSDDSISSDTQSSSKNSTTFPTNTSTGTADSPTENKSTVSINKSKQEGLSEAENKEVDPTQLQKPTTDSMNHPIPEVSSYSSNSVPPLVMNSKDEKSENKKKTNNDETSSIRTPSSTKSHSRHKKKAAKIESHDSSNLMPLGYIEISNVQHHKSKVSKALSSNELHELEQSGTKESNASITEKSVNAKEVYSLSELPHDFQKSKSLAMRVRSSSHSKLISSFKEGSMSHFSDTKSTPQKGSSLHSNTFIDPVGFQIDASHKVIYTCLSTLNLETRLKSQLEELLRNQMVFIHEAYKTQFESLNQRLKTKDNQIQMLQEELRNLKSKTASKNASNMKEPNTQSNKQTPVGSLLDLCNSVKGSIESINVKNSRSKGDIEGIRKENEQLRSYLEALISRILEYPEALGVLSVTPPV